VDSSLTIHGVKKMSIEKPAKKGHSVSLGKVIGIALIMLLVGMAVGGVLVATVIAPQLANLFGQHGDQGNTGDQNNNQNNNGNNNQNGYGNNNNNNNDQGPSVANVNPSPSNPTSNYGGDAQVNIGMPNGDGTTVSGTMHANIMCTMAQDGSNVQFSLIMTPTSVSDNLQQMITVGNGVTFNFVGTISGSQISADAQGSTGPQGQTVNFNFHLSGTIDQNTFAFTMNSASGSQITVSTQQITLYSN
jgi:hypothetical protein